MMLKLIELASVRLDMLVSEMNGKYRRGSKKQLAKEYSPPSFTHANTDTQSQTPPSPASPSTTFTAQNISFNKPCPTNHPVFPSTSRSFSYSSASSACTPTHSHKTSIFSHFLCPHRFCSLFILFCSSSFSTHSPHPHRSIEIRFTFRANTCIVCYLH